MKYSEWNNLLCDHFFNQREDMVFLAIDKEELIDLGLTSDKIATAIDIVEKNKAETIDRRKYVWNDFLRLFINLNSKKKFLDFFQEQISLTIMWSKIENGKPTVFPILSLIFIALAERSDRRDSNFYSKVNKFLRRGKTDNSVLPRYLFLADSNNLSNNLSNDW